MKKTTKIEPRFRSEKITCTLCAGLGKVKLIGKDTTINKICRCTKCNGKGYTLKPLVDILDYIFTGKDNIKSRSELCLETGLTDRAIRNLIHDARLDGTPIINIGDGYYIPDPDIEEEMNELYEFISLMRSRYIDINDTVGALTNWAINNSCID